MDTRIQTRKNLQEYIEYYDDVNAELKNSLEVPSPHSQEHSNYISDLIELLREILTYIKIMYSPTTNNYVNGFRTNELRG